MCRVQLTTKALGRVNRGLHHNGHFENLHVLHSLSMSSHVPNCNGAIETHLVNILPSALECEYHRTARGALHSWWSSYKEYRVMVPPRVVG